MFFDMNKDWNFAVGASKPDCEAAFRRAFDGKSTSMGKWRVGHEVVQSEHGNVRVLVAEMVGAGPLRGMTRQGQVTGAQIVFDMHGEDSTGRTRCTMALLGAGRYKSPRMIASMTANGDMIKKRMKRVARSLKQLDPKLDLSKQLR